MGRNIVIGDSDDESEMEASLGPMDHAQTSICTDIAHVRSTDNAHEGDCGDGTPQTNDLKVATEDGTHSDRPPLNDANGFPTTHNTPKNDGFGRSDVFSLSQEPPKSPEMGEGRKRKRRAYSGSFEIPSPKEKIIVQVKRSGLGRGLRDGEMLSAEESLELDQSTSMEDLPEPHNELPLRKNPSKAKGKDATLMSDDSMLGLPVEQYQPRPSRSRSGHMDGDLIEPVDYSKRPEKVGKSTRKRPKKKEGQVEILNENCQARNYGVVCPSAVAESDHKSENLKSLMDDNQIAVAISAEKDSNVASRQEPQKKPHGRPKKTIKEGEDQSSAVMGPELGRLNRTEESEVSKSGINREIDREGLNPLHNIQRTSQTISNEENHVSRQELAAISGNGIVENQHSFVSESKEDVESPKTPEKPAQIETKPTSKHSPISSGKVAHRVGLSKKAKIAPLLRIVRK